MKARPASRSRTTRRSTPRKSTAPKRTSPARSTARGKAPKSTGKVNTSNNVAKTGDVKKTDTGNRASGSDNSAGDRVTIGERGDNTRSDFVNPLDNMFNSSETKVAEAHASGDSSKGSFDVGARAEASSKKESVQDNGTTRHTEKQEKEAHATANASADLSKGQFSSEVDVGASVKHNESQVSRAETEIGGVRVAGEAGGNVDVNAEASARSRTELDLANGRIDHDSRAALGVDVKAGAHAASEVEALGVTRRDEVGVSGQVKGELEAHRQLKADENGVEASQGFNAEAKAMADATASTRYSTDAGSVEAKARGEASVFAEAHADSHFKLTEDELSFGARGGASAAAQLAAEGTVSGETANGSSFMVNGGANTGSVGAGAGVEFSRTDGHTSLGFESYGGLALAGGHVNGQMTIADRDIAEASVAPMTAGSSTYNAIGDGAQAASQVTEGMKQNAHSRQDFIEEMGSQSTGNMIADAGIATAGAVHGAYTDGVEFADTFAEEAARSYHDYGQRLGNTASRVADKVESGVGSALNYGVRKAHSGYQYGRAVGGGFIQGLGQGARNIGSFLNPFD